MIERVIFSRKGFDSASGGAPSPIVDGQPITLPIPTTSDGGITYPSRTTYDSIGLGDLIEQTMRGKTRKIARHDLCHHDPFYSEGQFAFGQEGAAQSHLERQSVGKGDVFLFFGLFREGREAPHHRIFAYMKIADILRPGQDACPEWASDHPHFLDLDQKIWKTNNTVYVGPGAMAARAHGPLRLTAPGRSSSIWRAPPWLRTAGLTYHENQDRWHDDGCLTTVGRGQEFVSHIANNDAAQR